MKKLDLGCGRSKKAGFIGLDCLVLPGVDIVHDLTKFPYPFEDGLIDEIWMDQCVGTFPRAGAGHGGIASDL